MSESTYRKTPLPVRLDLNKRNTKEQLSQGRAGLDIPSPASKQVNDLLEDLAAVARGHERGF